MIETNALASAIFVTGTDTDCGKTFVSSALISAYRSQGYRVVGMKPVASGSTRSDGYLVNDDVESLKRYSNVSLADRIVNPYIFEPAVSPHFAAAELAEVIDLDKIIDAFRQCRKAADVVIVEGAGGWRVPLGEQIGMSTLVQALNLPVLLVSGLKLGCINHTLLSAESIQNDGIDLVAWAANLIDPDYENVNATIQFIANKLQAPLAARFDWNHGHGLLKTLESTTGRQKIGAPDPELAADAINLDILLKRNEHI